MCSVRQAGSSGLQGRSTAHLLQSVYYLPERCVCSVRQAGSSGVQGRSTFHLLQSIYYLPERCGCSVRQAGRQLGGAGPVNLPPVAVHILPAGEMCVLC